MDAVYPMFGSDHLCPAQTCNICAAKTIAVHSDQFRLDESSSWENESTMRLLGLKTVQASLRFCPRCKHIFRSPLYDERKVYSKKSFQTRREAYERYFPGQSYHTFGTQDGVYGRDWFAQAADIFRYLNRLLALPVEYGVKVGQQSRLKILDWGGGDGYIGEALALISKKILNVNPEVYCYDYHTWTESSQSPYFQYIKESDLPRRGPFDLIIISCVLEHVAFPAELINQATSQLADGGLLLVVVPYEQPATWVFRNSYLLLHQNAFSILSLNRLLAGCGFTANTNIEYLSYRGTRMWMITALASRSGAQKIPWWLLYLVEPFILVGVTLHLAWLKVVNALKKMTRQPTT